MKNNLFIMGDSYSTYKGHIPSGYNTYYSDERTEAPIVRGVEKTWWRILAKENDMNIVVNDSYSGSTVSYTVRENHTTKDSFISRLDNYISNGFFEENKINTFLIFGGTNDSWINAPIGELKYSDLTEEDLKCVLPAFCYLIHKAKDVADDVVVILNTGLKQVIIDGIIEICQKTGAKYSLLKDIDKENGHPTELGMTQIAEQVSSVLNS